MIRQTSRSTRADTLFPNTTLFRSAADHLQHSRRDGMFDLTGKFALVTGATGGIGNAIAEALHAQGATVALSGTREAVLQELAGKLGSRSEEHTSELQSLMRISYAVFCLKKKKELVPIT